MKVTNNPTDIRKKMLKLNEAFEMNFGFKPDSYYTAFEKLTRKNVLRI